MSKWKNPVVIRLNPGINGNPNTYTLLERVTLYSGHNEYIFVDEFSSMDKEMKNRHKILERYGRQQRRKKTA